MRALPEGDGSVLPLSPDGAAGTRRLVAVAVSAVDVLHPGSDLRQVAGAASEMDVLIARVDRPGTARRPLPMDAVDYLEDHCREDGPGGGHDTVEDLLAGLAVPLSAYGYPNAPHLPASLSLHHLDLRWRVQEADEADLVAALSELIGFDPDDRVFCVAPAAGPDGVRDPEQAVVDRAVRRVARVYGLPVLHYRRVEDGTGAGVAHAAPEPAV